MYIIDFRLNFYRYLEVLVLAHFDGHFASYCGCWALIPPNPLIWFIVLWDVVGGGGYPLWLWVASPFVCLWPDPVGPPWNKMKKKKCYLETYSKKLDESSWFFFCTPLVLWMLEVYVVLFSIGFKHCFHYYLIHSTGFVGKKLWGT